MRTIKSNRGLVAAMENDEVVTDAPAVPEEPRDDTLETDLTEIAETEGEVIEQEDAIDEAADQIEALENLHISLRASLETGGMTRSHAATANTMLSYIHKRQGFRSSRVLGVEAFGESNSRAESTRLAMEGVAETAKKVWEAIVAAFERMKKLLVEFFNKIFDGATKLKARAEKVASAASDTKGAAPKEKEFENEGIANAIHIGGKVALANYDVLAEVIQPMANGYKKHVDEYVKPALEAMKKFADGGGKMEDLPDIKEQSAVGGHLSSASGNVPENCKGFESKELPGGQRLRVIVPESFEYIGRAESGFVAAGENVTVDAKLETLSPNQVKALAEKIGKFADSLLSMKAGLAESSRLKSDATNVAKKIGALAEKNEDETERGLMKMLQDLARFISQKGDKPFPSVGKYGVEQGKRWLDYGEASLRQYSGK